ncbi:MAG: single-stranded DNA-binding protein [Cytophagales bacterium]|nr:single-stranded DNA-binding protein [Cytophagales bacterium]
MSDQSPQNQTQDALYSDTNISMKSGRLVKDAETIAEGRFIKFRIASNKQYLDQNQEIKAVTNYFNVLVSSNLTDAFEEAQSLKKGEWVYIKGEDNSKSFDTPEGYKQNAVTTFAYKVAKKDNSQTEIPEQTGSVQPS